MKKIVALLFIICFFNLSAQVPAYVPTLGLTGFWPFTGNANDVSGNGNNGTVNGASLASDRFSNSSSAYSFNGTSNYISVPSATSLTGFTDMSISTWITIGSLPTNVQGIVTKWYQVSCTGNLNNSDSYEAALSGSNVQFATNNNNLTGFTSPPPLASSLVNTWVHLTFTSHSTQGLAIYINAALAGTFATSGSICNSINSLYFGADFDGNSSSFHRFFNGKIDDIGIWNRVLTNCEIQQLYTSTSGTLNAISSMSAICSGASATLTGSGIGPSTWTPGGSVSPTIVVSPSVTTIYTLTSACGYSTTVALIVNPTPTLGATINPPTVCSGSSATITATGAITYSWIGIGTGSAIVVNPTAQTTYTVIGSNGICSSTLIRVQNVVPSPTLFISSSDTIICTGGTVNLNATGAIGYTWQPGNGSGPNYSVAPLVTTVYTVSGTNNSGCITSKTWTIFVGSVIPLTASANPTLICPGASCTLTASGASSYTWLPGNLQGAVAIDNPTTSTTYTVFGETGSCLSSATVNVKVGLDIAILPSGDLCNNNFITLSFSPGLSGSTATWSGPGIIGSVNNFTALINAPGLYSVVVTNTLTGCSGTASVTISSTLNPLSFSITPSTTLACFPGPPVTLLISSSANYNWLPSAEVTPSSGPLVSVSPSVTSTYTALGQLGACTGTAVVTISVNPMPTLTVVNSIGTICSGVTLTLSASGANEYSWLPGNLSGPTVTVNPGFSTTYTVTGANGNCSSTFTLPVNVLPVAQLTTSASPVIICAGSSSTLTVGGTSLTAWIIGNPPLSHTAVVSPTVTSTYTAIGTNSLGCSSFATIQVNVIQSPVITATTSSTEICAGETITLTAMGSSNYTWMPGSELGASIVVNPTVSTNYNVVSDNPSCSHANVFVLVNNCVNISLGITNAAELPENYGGDFYRIRFIVTANNASSSDLVNVILSNDLASTFSQPITYTVVDAPFLLSKNSMLSANPLFNGSSDMNLTVPLTSTLGATTRDTLAFTILVRPNGFAGTLKNSVIGTATDKNNLTARDTSNNGFALDPDNDGDPTNNNLVTPIELELIDFFIPEGFSPDDDGRNDLFVVKGLNGRTAKLTIFNRWGNKVFAKEGTELTWDGKANVNALGHDKLPPSTYYYIFEFSERRSKIITGFIVLQY